MTTTESVLRTIKDARQRWDENKARERRNVALALRVLGVTQTELAAQLGMSRQFFYQKLSGKQPLHAWELAGIAEVLGIPTEVFQLTEGDLLKWIADHREERLSRSRCFIAVAA